MKDNIIGCIILYVIPFILGYCLHFYLFAGIYVFLLTLLILISKKSDIKNKFTSFWKDWREIRALKYYYISDSLKREEYETRNRILNIITNIGAPFVFIALANIIAFRHVLSWSIGGNVLGDSLVEIFTITPVIVLFIPLLFIFMLRFTTITYCIGLPSLSIGICYFGIEHFSDLFTVVQLLIYLALATIFYLILIFGLPLNMLRKLSASTIIFSSLVTILIGVLTQAYSFLADNLGNKQAYLTTLDKIMNKENLSSEIKMFFMENEDFVDIVNYFIELNMNYQLNNFIMPIATGLTLSFLISGLMITMRNSKKKTEANLLYREIVLIDKSISYEKLIKCAYLGGEEFELLILNNPCYVKIIKDREEEHIVLSAEKESNFKRLKKFFFGSSLSKKK
ncbi:TPA: hypothetical protein H9318_001310 [Listeria monocytogenes]|nr:hypothetical protein [Listeria monocytogenes]